MTGFRPAVQAAQLRRRRLIEMGLLWMAKLGFVDWLT